MKPLSFIDDLQLLYPKRSLQVECVGPAPEAALPAWLAGTTDADEPRMLLLGEAGDEAALAGCAMQLQRQQFAVACIDASRVRELRTALEAGGYQPYLADAEGWHVYLSAREAEENPCVPLARKLLEARGELQDAQRETQLASSRQALIVSALRKERAAYQKQIWRTSKRIKSHLSYRLGAAIVAHAGTLRGTWQLPRALLAEYRSFRNEREQLAEEQLTPQARLLNIMGKQRGYHGVVAHVEKLSPEAREALDEESFSQHVIALANAFQFEKCVEVFEQRYTEERLLRPRLFEYPLLRAYIRSLTRCGRADDAEVLLERLIRRYPNQADYYSLIGFVLAGHKPAEARSYLRIAIMLGSANAHTDATLLYRTLLLEGLPLKEAWGDVVCVLELMAHNRFALDAMDFLQSTMKLEQGNSPGALRSFNNYLTRHRLPTAILADKTQPFGMDNLSVPACRPISVHGPLVSILITTYNSAEFMDTAMMSLLNQTYANLELIVVDDCSTDNTRAKLAAWAKRDARVRVFHNANNVGTYGSKNLGLLNAKGDFITCHDSDDWSHPMKIELQVTRLRKSKAMACHSRWARIDERGYFEAKRWGQVLHTNPASLLYRRAVVDAIGFYDTVRTGADTEFHHRIVNRFGAASVFEIKICLSLGRSHSGSLTRSSLLGFDEFGASPFRQAYWAAWGEWHLRAMRTAPESLFVNFPPGERRAFEIPAEITVSADAARRNVEALRPKSARGV